MAFCHDGTLKWMTEQGNGRLGELSLLDCSIVVGVIAGLKLDADNHPIAMQYAAAAQQVEYRRRWSEFFELVRRSSVKSFVFGELQGESDREEMVERLPFRWYALYRYRPLRDYPAGGWIGKEYERGCTGFDEVVAQSRRVWEEQQGL